MIPWLQKQRRFLVISGGGLCVIIVLLGLFIYRGHTADALQQQHREMQDQIRDLSERLPGPERISALSARLEYYTEYNDRLLERLRFSVPDPDLDPASASTTARAVYVQDELDDVKRDLEDRFVESSLEIPDHVSGFPFPIDGEQFQEQWRQIALGHFLYGHLLEVEPMEIDGLQLRGELLQTDEFTVPDGFRPAAKPVEVRMRGREDDVIQFLYGIQRPHRYLFPLDVQLEASDSSEDESGVVDLAATVVPLLPQTEDGPEDAGPDSDGSGSSGERNEEEEAGGEEGEEEEEGPAVPWD